jgi:hypothetical protein
MLRAVVRKATARNTRIEHMKSPWNNHHSNHLLNRNKRRKTTKMGKRKHGAGIAPIAPKINETLNQLLDKQPPPLRLKDNMGLESTAHTENTGHEPASVTESTTNWCLVKSSMWCTLVIKEVICL